MGTEGSHFEGEMLNLRPSFDFYVCLNVCRLEFCPNLFDQALKWLAGAEPVGTDIGVGTGGGGGRRGHGPPPPPPFWSLGPAMLLAPPHFCRVFFPKMTAKTHIVLFMSLLLISRERCRFISVVSFILPTYP